MLSTQAWNAFLKTLEEPPPNTIFVLATTEADEGAADGRRPLPPLRLRAPDGRAARAACCAASPSRSRSRSRPTRVALLARHATGSFRDALGTLEQLVTYSGTDDRRPTTCSPCSASPTRTCSSARSTRSPRTTPPRRCWPPRASPRPAATWRSLARDLEAHARELLVVQTLGERARRAARHARARRARWPSRPRACRRADVVRLLDLLADGAARRSRTAPTRARSSSWRSSRPRRPRSTPSTKALLARIERLGASARSPRRGRRRPAAAPRRPPAAAQRRSRRPRRPPPRRPTPAPPAARPQLRSAPPEPRRRSRARPRPRRRAAPPSRRAARRDRRRRRRPPSAAAPRRRGRRRAGAAPPTVDGRCVRGLAGGDRDTVCASSSMLGAALDSARPGRARRRRARHRVPAERDRSTGGSRRENAEHRRTARRGAARRHRRRPLRLAYELRELDGAERPPSRRWRTTSWSRGSMQEFDAEEIVPDPPRRASLMPQPPNMQQMMQPGPEDAAGHDGRAGAAQGRGGRGLRRRRHGDRADHRRPQIKAVTIDPDAIDPEDPELLQDMVTAATNEAIRSAQELAEPSSAASPAAWAGSACRACDGRRDVACVHAAPVQRLITELGQAAGHRPAHRAAAGVPHPARRRRGRRSRSPTRSARSRRRSASARSASTSPRGRAARSASTSAATTSLICVVEEPGDVDPDRAHARVPRPLPRARRRALADRRRRPRGPARSPSSTRASRRPTRRSARSCSRRTRRRPARRPRCTSRAASTSARPTSPSRAWPPACRSARPRVRRRGHARPRAGRPARAVARRASAAADAGARRARPHRRARLVSCASMSQGTIVMKFGGTSVADAERLKRAAGASSRKREEGYRVVAVLCRARQGDRPADRRRLRGLRAARPARDGHAALDRRARLVRAVRDGDQRPRPPRDLADRLAGRDRHRHLAHEGADPRRARRPHRGGARRGQRSCSSPASRASRPPRTSRRSAAAARTRPRSRSPRPSAPRSARSTPTSPASSAPTRGSSPTRASSTVVSFEEMLEMAASGAGVLQLRSVEYARNHGVRIHCRSSFDDEHRYRCRLGAGDHGTPAHHRRHPLDRRGPRHADGRPRHARHRRPDRDRARRRERQRRHDHPERAGLRGRARGHVVHRPARRPARRARRARAARRRARDRRDRRPTSRWARSRSSAPG